METIALFNLVNVVHKNVFVLGGYIPSDTDPAFIEVHVNCQRLAQSSECHLKFVLFKSYFLKCLLKYHRMTDSSQVIFGLFFKYI